MKNIRKILSLIMMVCCLVTTFTLTAYAEEEWPADIDIYSPSAIVVEVNTGTVLYEKNADEQLYPASITKIMTALLAIENNDLSEEVTFSYDSVHKTEGSGIARDVGEVMTLEECLYGMMLESSNECAYAIAEHVGGTYDNFIKMMNAKAAELGCTNTHFNNPNGLPDENHYVSARDMALIASAAYKNETFRIICGTKTYQIPPTNKHSDITYLRNHHNMLFPLTTSQYVYEYCTGGKTGYTSVAKSTLVTYAEKDGLTLACVVMHTDSPHHYTDTIKLFNYCFDNFKIWNIAENDTTYSGQQESFFNTKASVFSSDSSMVSLDTSAKLVLPANIDFSAAESSVEYSDNSQDNVLGSVVYTYAGKTVGTASLLLSDASATEFSYPSDTAAGSEETKPVRINITHILLCVVVVIVLLVVIALAFYLFKNFYIIRHKYSSKKGQPEFNDRSKKAESFKFPWSKHKR